MDILEIVCQVLLVLSSLFLILLILMHKGSGGGMSDMFGGGTTSNLSGSSMAERNLNRITVAMASVWFLAIIGLGLIARFK